MKKLNLLLLVVGVITGAAGSLLYFKKYYENIAQEEIDSVKETYKAKYDPNATSEQEKNEEATSKSNEKKSDSDIYSSILSQEKYVKRGKASSDEPYIIPPENFGELDDYEEVSLIYYSDGVLTDDMDEVIENPGDIVVENFETHFGEYEDDSVFVRNDILKCDYEILKDDRSFRDVVGS